jgi:acyl carrier protein
MSLPQVIANVLGVDVKLVTDESGMKTLKAWNSSRHVELVMALEGEYDLQFSTAEIVSLQSVRQIRDVLARHGITT